MLSPGERAILEVSWGDLQVQAAGDEVQAAKSRPLDSGRISEQLRKTGDTPYEFEELNVRISGDVFLPMSSLNRLRRDALSALAAEKAASARRKIPARTDRKKERVQNAETEPVFTASCESAAQAERLCGIPEIRRIYCSLDFISEILEKSPDCEIALALPHVVRPGDMDRLAPVIRDVLARGCAGILARSPESAAWLIRHGYAADCILDGSVYTFNNESIAFWEEAGVARTTAPMELNRRELAGRDNARSEILIYGRQPMMISAQCIRRNLDRCAKDSGILTMTDRFRKEFPVKCYCNFCYNVIYNSLPCCLFAEAEDIKKLGFSGIRLAFTVESPGEAARIAENAVKCFRKEEYSPPHPLTKGHFNRGVE